MATADLVEVDQKDHGQHYCIDIDMDIFPIWLVVSGYMSQEYAIDGVFSVKPDVFSFGILLLEVISGKRSNGYYHEDLPMNLIAYVWNLWREGIALDVVDSCLADTYPSHEVLRCIQVGLLCVKESASDRPTMSDVVFMLVNETNLPIPKQSTFVVNKTCDDANSSGEGIASGSVNYLTITTTEAQQRLKMLGDFYVIIC